jgi:hypothetical protein
MLDDRLLAHVTRVLGSPIASTTTAQGGFSPATRERVVLADGTRAFVKAATNAETAGWLRDEWRVYGALEVPFLPAIRHWDAKQAVLILEDLGDCGRAPPWTPSALAAVQRTLAELAACQAPVNIPDVSPALFRGWRTVASDPAPLIRLGVAPEAWIRDALPALVAAETHAPVQGDGLLHLDLRGDNLFLRNERAVLVDWNWAARGNPALDAAFWAPSLQLDGGPPPERLVGSAPELAAAVSGFFALRAGQSVEAATPAIRAFQLAQLRLALPRAARALGLPALRP